jgi:hypothetical protein
MTHYSNQQSMIFNLLKNIDYSQTWEQIDYDLGYNLGDYNFGNNDKECRKLVRSSAKMLWAIFNGVINSKGDIE